jgi:hypothetical protein
MRMNDHNVEQCPTTRSVVATSARPSRLPSRSSNSEKQSSNNVPNNRSVSAQKVSKLPIRTTTSLNRQQTSIKKSNIPTPVVAKTKKNTTIISNHSIPSVNNTTIKNPIRPPPVIQLPSNKIQSHSITTTEKNNISSPLNKSPKTIIETVQSNDPIQQINSTSSESSTEEQQQYMNKLLPILQDEGYSTWSSIDVIRNNVEKNETDDRQRNIGLVKTWLDTTNRQCSNKPVKEGMN